MSEKNLLLFKASSFEQDPIYAVNIETVQEILQANQFKRVKPFNGVDYLSVRECLVPLIQLSDYLNIPRTQEDDDQEEPSNLTIVVHIGDKKLGLLVNKVLTVDCMNVEFAPLDLSIPNQAHAFKLDKDGSLGMLLDVDLLFKTYLSH